VLATSTIRTKLIQIVLTLVIPGWIAMAGVIYSFYREERAHVLQNTIGISRSLMSAVDRDLVSMITAAQVLAASPTLRSDDLAAFHREATELVPFVFGSNFVLSDASGQQIVNTLRPYGEPLPAHGDPISLEKTFATGKPVISDLFVGAMTKKPFVSVEVPVFRGKEVRYVLGVGIAPQRLNEILKRQQLPPNWIAVVIDSSGAIVARTHSPDRFVGKQAATGALKALSENHDGAAEIVTVEGIPAIAAFSQSDISHWAVSIAIPLAELPTISNSYLLVSVLGALILLSIGLGFASYQSTLIARAVSGLIPPAIALGLGEAPKTPKLGVREADEVAQALDRTYHLLRRRTDERDVALRNEVESQIATKIQDEFVATVSHELRTPLTSIAGALGLLSGGATGPLPATASRLISIAHTNVQRLLRLINDILDIAKFESGDMTFKFAAVDLRATIEQAMESNLSFAHDHGVRMRLEQASSRCTVWADSDRLNQVFTNLLSNAIKFSSAGQEIVVAVGRREQTAYLTVRDRGPGIPDAFKPHLFDKFSQADTGNARQKSGSGLGLHIVRNIVSRHDGVVGFEDAPDGGTIFFVEIPLWSEGAMPELSSAIGA
jgi:two-component system, sensor histidine kinase and response regulator